KMRKGDDATALQDGIEFDLDQVCCIPQGKRADRFEKTGPLKCPSLRQQSQRLRRRRALRRSLPAERVRTVHLVRGVLSGAETGTLRPPLNAGCRKANW